MDEGEDAFPRSGSFLLYCGSHLSAQIVSDPQEPTSIVSANEVRTSGNTQSKWARDEEGRVLQMARPELDDQQLKEEYVF